MNVDLSYVEQVSLIVISAVCAVVVPWMALQIDKHLKIASNSATAARVESGVNALAQLAVGELSQEAAAHPSIEVKNAAVARAMNTASNSLKTAQAALGTTDEMLATRVAGQVAAMLNTPPVTPIAAAPAAEPVK